MKSIIGHRTHITVRWSALLIALTVTMASLLQAATIKPAFADTGSYPWPLAPCADSGAVLGQTTGTGYWCSGYNWGESPCPSGDGFCTSNWLMNGYYLLDQWGEGFRNCVSYTAWKLNQQFGINTTNWGNGKDWNNSALAAHYTDDTSPQIGDIAQWDATPSNSFGHVAYVYNVVSGVASYDEYNYARDGTFDSSQTSTTQGAPTHWIHIGTVATPTSAMPISSQLTAGGVQHVFTGTPGGNVYDTHWTDPTMPTTDLITGTPLGTSIVSLSSQYIGGVVHVYAATSGGSIVDIYYGGGQTLGQRQVWSNGVNGDVITSLVDSGGYQHVEVGDSSGNVRDFYWTGIGTVGSQQVGFSLGNAVISLSAQYPGGVVHVYAATSSGSIDDIYWGGGQTLGQRQVWSNGVNGDVITSLVDSGGYQHVEVGDSSHNVRDFYWTGIGTVGSQQVGFDLGSAITSLSAQYPGGVVHVYAATSAGNTDDIYWGGGQTLGQRPLWGRSDTTGNGLSSQIDGSGVQQVFTAITAGSIYDTHWTGIGTPYTDQVK